jgi:hypothetical protein
VSSVKFYNKDYPAELPIRARFAGMDSEDAFKKSLEEQPDDWEYRNKEVYYDINTQGFRTYDLDTVDWDNSIVLFGCSQVFGVGLAEEDTLAKQIEELVDVPVINLAVGGGSNDITTANMSLLAMMGARPRAVVNFWTSPFRFSFFQGQDRETITIGPWVKAGWAYAEEGQIDFAEAYYGYVNNCHFYEKLNLQRIQQNLAWRGVPTQVIDASFFKDVAKFLELDYIERTDFARDLGHNGKDTTKRAAEYVVGKLV